MERIIHRIDSISEFVGKTAAWMIIPLTFALGYEVFARYLFSAPTTWAFDLGITLYGSYFMLASAYALRRNAHVRGDIFYRNFPDRTQAIIDLSLYILVFFPAMLALMYMGTSYFWASFRIRETSAFSPYARPIYPLKAAIPLAALLLFLQGIAQALRCVIAIRTGAWPDKEEVRPEEMETVA